MKNPLMIGALAKAIATNVETTRYYERIGLLPGSGSNGPNLMGQCYNGVIAGCRVISVLSPDEATTTSQREIQWMR